MLIFRKLISIIIIHTSLCGTKEAAVGVANHALIEHDGGCYAARATFRQPSAIGAGRGEAVAAVLPWEVSIAHGKAVHGRCALPDRAIEEAAAVLWWNGVGRQRGQELV